MFRVKLANECMRSVSSKLSIEDISLPENIRWFIFRGRVPTAEQILQSSDLIELKKCIYASQVHLSLIAIFILSGSVFLAINIATHLYA